MHGLSTTSIPLHLQTAIGKRLQGVGLDLQRDGGKIAQAVLSLSKFYISQPNAATPYHQPWAQNASIAYYLPLNTIRMIAVLHHAKALGFLDGISSVLDVGSGLGAVSFAASAVGFVPATFNCIERDSWASGTHRLLLGLAGGSGAGLAPHQWQVGTVGDGDPRLSKADLVTFSFSLTEFKSLPSSLKDAPNILIVEPGTSEDGRSLMQHRSTLIEWGFKVWAPCTHQETCPLLTQSARDWCHDRIFWDQPDWYQAIEADLPMRNHTLPFSYLLASRRDPPEKLAGVGRLVGDSQSEKGRTKQLFCRKSRREFAVWQTRHGAPPELRRGELMRADPLAKQAGDGVHLLPSEWSVAEWP